MQAAGGFEEARLSRIEELRGAKTGTFQQDVPLSTSFLWFA